jgi:hypothetical protein
MWTWLLLLALVVVLIYWFGVRQTPSAPSCSACAKRQVVSPVD